jgi:hypothetical protein
VTGAAVRRLSFRDAWTTALVATLVRPVTWALGLLGFLAGGGLVLVAWPILVLPTLTGLQTLLGAPVTTLVFGVPTAGLVLLVGGGVLAALVIVVGAVLVGAWAEREGIGVTLEAAAEEHAIAPVPLEGAPGTVRVAVIRLLALVPVVLVAALSTPRLYEVVYHELILPDDLGTPLPIRVIRAVPVHLGLLLLVWLLSDGAGAIGVRRLVLERRGVMAAFALGWIEVVRHPVRSLGTAVGGALLVALMLGPSLAAAALGYGRLQEILVQGRGPLFAVIAVLAWVAVWIGGLVLGSVATGVRASAWTMIAFRHPT